MSTTNQTIEQRVAALEQWAAQIKMAAAGPTAPATHAAKPAASSGEPANGYPAPKPGEEADDALLDKPWADMEVRKDPPKWQGAPCAGKRMSQCPADYLADYASFHDWKAKKGRAEDPPRLNDKGKPWYERDELIAKLARGWARRAREHGHVTFVDPRQAALPGTPDALPVVHDAHFDDTNPDF